MSDTTKLRFNCYLLREGVDSPEEALRIQYRANGSVAMRQLAPTKGAPEGCTAYFSTKTDGEPPWARSLSHVFPQLSEVRSLSHRLVVFLPVQERMFAVCFGYGSSTLEWSRIEANFGLRFASRAYNTLALNEIRSRRIDSSARTQSVQIPNRSGLREFDMELEGEFVRRLVGELDGGVETPDLGAVVATDSIAFKAKTNLHEVKRILAKMLDTVTRNETHEDLRFIDSLVPLRAKSEIAAELEKLLAQELFEERVTKQSTPGEEVAGLTSHLLSFAPPDDLAIENVHSIRVKRGETIEYMQEMHIDSLRTALSSFKGSFGRAVLKDIRVMALDSDGNPASNSTPLKNWLIFEAGSDEERFLLTIGKWFALAEGYARQLDEDLAKIEDATEALHLPGWNIHKHNQKRPDIKPGEESYNYDAAAGRSDLVFMDTDTIASIGSQVEACDLFHASGHLIHVKKYANSQTLSHLFSQGYVAAQTLTEDPDYKRKFVEKIEGHAQDLRSCAEEAPEKVTYAIAVRGDRTIPGSLPTFSKVNLRGFVRKLRRMQVQPSLARIQMH